VAQVVERLSNKCVQTPVPQKKKRRRKETWSINND
jgi:hypothetical protein